MALTDNDEVFDDPLTEAEYALGTFFARHFTEDGRFIGLPGYEWTSHVPNANHRMGFAGNSDSHRRHPGLAGALTAVYAEALTGDAILEALHNRRFYATNGPRIVLDSRANGSLIGQQIEAPDGIAEIALTAIGTRPIVSATLVGDSKDLKTFSGTGQREFHARYRTQPLGPGTHWFYWRIVQEGSSPQFPGNVCVARGHLAWCSPHWVTVPGTRAAARNQGE